MRRRLGNFRFVNWQQLLWGMALLGLLLLPSDFRAGAESAHAHSLAQLWLDAADGSIHHHLHDAWTLSSGKSRDWFDPAFGIAERTPPTAAETQPDVGEHHDSVPVTSGVHLLLTAALFLPVISMAHGPLPTSSWPLSGRCPRIPLPPPRWLSAMA